ncbi:polyprotein [Pagoda yellow mosaic associated virus]|uniref:RNA-directed DNA polymerase n=1 Tax=Pagoda yellow mosaic associated virus TaxID=1505530 RepID=A0A060GPM8_9VIRU|nr:polyprotein [Pagoda yellow mosaic associated virus]AIB53751.1 polyprotein [Pagoda yellow mosaic associated virus]
MSQTQTVTTPVVEDQIRDYRRMQRARHEAQRILPPILGGRRRRQIQGPRRIEEELDPNMELSASSRRRATMVPAEVLYSTGDTRVRNRVYEHYSEQRGLIVNNQEDFRFIQESSYNTLRNSGYEHMHVGMMMMRVLTLHRTYTGVTALVTFRDTRWHGELSILGQMELDLSEGSQLVFTTPNLLCSIHDFYHHIQVAIITRGYDTWVAGESNLLITRGLVARVTNSSVSGFRFGIEGVLNYFNSRGVMAIKAQRRSTVPQRGIAWELRPSSIPRPIQAPTNAVIRETTRGTLSTRFSGYDDIPARDSYQSPFDKTEYAEDGDTSLPKRFNNVTEGTSTNFALVILASCNPDFPEDDQLADGNFYTGQVLTDWEDDYLQDWLTDEPAPQPTAAPLPTLSLDEAEDIMNDFLDRYFSDEKDSTTVSSFSVEREVEVPVEAPEIRKTLEPEPVSDEEVQWEVETIGTEVSDVTQQALPIYEEAAEQETIATQLADELSYKSLHKMQKKLVENMALSGAESSGSGAGVYNPYSMREDNSNRPPGYAAAQGLPQNIPDVSHFTASARPPPKSKQPYGAPAMWNLPSAQQTQGVMLVLPYDIGKYAEVINRWESINVNLVNSMNWDSNQDKVDFMENLLGETEKQIFVSWRMQFEDDYRKLVSVAGDIRNVTSAIRVIFLTEDPAQGSTMEQDRAYADLERLPTPEMKNIFQFLNQYKKLAAASGRMWITPELSEKLFRKLPPVIGPAIEKAYKQRYPGMDIGVPTRINFIYQYLMEVCKQAALQRSLKDLSFCAQVPIPGDYNREGKKYGLRRASTYKGKPHATHVRTFKRKDAGKQRKCACFICGEPDHFAKECPRNGKGNINRVHYYDNLNIPEDWDIMSVDPEEPMSDAICSMSEGEAGFTATAYNFEDDLPYGEPTNSFNFGLVLIQGPVPDVNASSWMPRHPLEGLQLTCIHVWEENAPIQATENKRCGFCRNETRVTSRILCPACKLVACLLCASRRLGIEVRKEEEVTWKFQNKDELINSLYHHNAFLIKENSLLKEQLQLAQRRIANNAQLTGADLQAFMEDYRNLTLETAQKIATETPKPVGKAALTWREEAEAAYKEELATRKNWRQKKKIGEEEDEEEEEEEIIVGAMHESILSSTVKGATRRLYNIRVTFEIPDVPKFTAMAILDTGATCCCIDQRVVPAGATEDAAMQSTFLGVNSKTIAKKRIKAGKMFLGDNYFKIPYIYCFQMQVKNIDMLIGCNFIKSMGGGLRIEGPTITFYKNVTSIQTQAEELGVISMEKGEGAHQQQIAELTTTESVLDVQEAYFARPEQPVDLKFKHVLGPILKDLMAQGYIGEDPVRHWVKNQVICRLDIINPDITIQSQPLKHVTVEMERSFQTHVDGLLKLKVIRPSKSRHRTLAILVKSGTSIDPLTGKEVKGKERMVYDYRQLNNNTHKDQYSLPGINTIIQKVGRAKVYSKFDLKSGFHQVAMDEASIPWTAFLVPGGLYEWLVMPFGLRNAPAIFQRKMDEVFADLKEFVSVYIDDILVFSETYEEHAAHLKRMLQRCKKFGLVLSPTKMKIATREIDFLGATIKDGRIKLQDHIIKKISTVDEKSLETTKGLRSWLGIINYARGYIPNCGTLLGPLYSKVGLHGDKRWKSSDWQLVRKVKAAVENLPELEIPPKNCHIIIETDGCMEGWGGVCKWCPPNKRTKGEERVCAYVSGKFPTVKSTIDAEIFAVMESLSALKIFFLDKEEITVRTDCQAIIAFYNKQAQNKPSRVRWLAFCDYINGNGLSVKFEHIKGEENVLADQLSRITALLFVQEWPTQEEVEELGTFLTAIDDTSSSSTLKTEDKESLIQLSGIVMDNWCALKSRHSSTALDSPGAQLKGKACPSKNMKSTDAAWPASKTRNTKSSWYKPPQLTRSSARNWRPPGDAPVDETMPTGTSSL